MAHNELANIKICAGHAQKPGSCGSNNGECGGLHICKFFLLSGRCRFGEKCSFGHDYNCQQNFRVFISHYINPSEIQIHEMTNSFRQINTRNSTTMPNVCSFYNTAKTCTNPKCRNLHMCRHFLEGTCRFNEDCKRNHNVSDPAVTNVLEDFGFSFRLQSPMEVLNDLKQFYQKTMPPSSVGTPRVKPSEVPAVKRNISGKDRSSENVTKEQTNTICIHHLRGKCLFGKNCKNHHTLMIYQWQWKSDSDVDWVYFKETENSQLEKCFSQVSIRDCQVNIGANKMKIDFELMKGFMGADTFTIERLTTISSKNAPASIQQWTTEWHWYWQDETGSWKEYGQPNRTDGAVDSDSIEEKYLANPAGSFSFTNKESHYLLMFPKMTQTNINTTMTRCVRRRPTFFQSSDIEKRTVQMSSASVMSLVPKDWTVTGKDIFDHYKVTMVSKGTKEFQDIDDFFHETMPSNHSIESLARIENGFLWNNFSTKKGVMERKLKKKVDERRLFHGTHSDNIDAICHQGFDFRFSGKAVGTLHGKGSYFATTANYSHCYTRDSKKMFVALTLVGDFSKGDPSYVRPPPKDPSQPFGDLFDSCVDRVDKPGIFVFFDLQQVYPQYLITY